MFGGGGGREGQGGGGFWDGFQGVRNWDQLLPIATKQNGEL